MLNIAIAFSRYFVALLFGTAVSVNIVGMERTQKNYVIFWSFILTLFLFQVICLKILGIEIATKAYPLISHLPVVIFIVIYLKRTWLISFTSVFISFLCCQPPRWIGSILGEIFKSISMNHIGYIAGAIFIYYLLKKYAFKSVHNLMERSVKSCLIFGSMPAFYYIFDYMTTVYTDFMYRGSRTAIHFMPSIAATFYFIFILGYYAETLKQERTQREMDMLQTQFTQAQKEFNSLKQIQQNAASYRHDMRHHFSFLQGLAAKNQIEEIQTYLQTALSDMDAITPIRFCENETVNLILSAFSSKAKQANIDFTVDAILPDILTFTDTELCSLLSNALENAIHACKKIEDSNKRFIKLRIYSKNTKLCIDIKNSYDKEPEFQKGLPISNAQGHGFGTKSMIHIIEKHGGVFQFSAKEGWFTFQATA